MPIFKTKQDKIETIIILSFVLSGFIFIQIKDYIEFKKLEKEYPLLKKEHKINGIIIYKYNWLANEYRDFLSISNIYINKEKYSLIANEIEGNNYGINEIIEVGDSILKTKDNDTIIVKKKGSNKIHLFLRRDKLYDD